MDKTYNCIDAGSKYCPCNLANTMNCISCSHLAGEDFCDCSWNGVCILYEYYMNNKQYSDFKKTYRGIVIGKVFLDKNLILLKIKLDKKLLNELNTIGSYVFIRKVNCSNYYDTPMSIFNIDEDYIYIVYQEIGPKTKNIQCEEELSIRGPYWNGIIGEHKLSKVSNSNILIIVRGIGQSSILIPLNKLIKRNNKVVLFLDKGKLNSLYCLNYISDKNIRIEMLDLFSSEGEKKLIDFIRENPIDVVLSAGSEMLHRNVTAIVKESRKDIKIFVTNNNILCCGEGICGSCTRKIDSGERIKTCKTLIDPKQMY
ncbi:MAG: sulfide/dihydroorotate dehydrogenase-like FAD/NAD-binding protein [Tissierellia bacterium]|nr:sulfide/dihydroorotate dehydrogenase-like FAD/NAD-binding protein [Tissierellia bacterium]